jgi:hypothetical protein
MHKTSRDPIGVAAADEPQKRQDAGDRDRRHHQREAMRERARAERERVELRRELRAAGLL